MVQNKQKTKLGMPTYKNEKKTRIHILCKFKK